MNPSDQYIPALRYRWLTPLYDTVVGVTTREHLFKHRLLKQAALQPDWDVIDLGCGTGTLAIWAKQLQPNARVVGLDGDPQILEIASRKARRLGASLEFYEGLSYRLPFDDNTYDCVLSSLFFHHLQPEQKAATLTEVRRILRPGGVLNVADWGESRGLLSRFLFYPVQLLDGFSSTRDHLAGKLPQYISQAGFRDVEVTESFLTMYGYISLFYGRCPAEIAT